MMNSDVLDKLEPPRFVDGKPLLLAGLSEHYNCDTSAGIPMQWQLFGPYIGAVPGEVGKVAYGVRFNSDDQGNMDYLCAVEVSDFERVPQTFTRLRIPAQRYAVFAHRDHVSTIRRTWHTIWNVWLPQSGQEILHVPDFERYGETFDARTGNGGLEIWVPIKA